jgi:hypothetical protein
MPYIHIREDYALTVACELCHLSAEEAVAVLRHRLEHRLELEACTACVCRMGNEVVAQMQRRPQ